MSVTVTGLTVTPSWSQKRLVIAGTAAVRESVSLRLVGCGDDTSVVFKFMSEDGRTDYARFPWASTDAWTVDGADLTATLNLNTDKLVAAFAGYGPTDIVGAVATVSSPTNANLYAIGCYNLRNWVDSEEDPVAYLAPIQADIAAIEADISALEATAASHAHDGTSGNGGSISHTSLTNKGTLTHPALESALNSHTVAINDLVSTVATLGNAVSTVSTAADAAAVDAPESDLDKVGLETITTSLVQIYNWIQAFKGGLT